MWNGTMFVDLDWPLNASSLLSASAELLVFYRGSGGANRDLDSNPQPSGHTPFRGRDKYLPIRWLQLRFDFDSTAVRLLI